MVLNRHVQYSSLKKVARPFSGNGVTSFQYNPRMTKDIIRVAALNCLLTVQTNGRWSFVKNTSENEPLMVHLFW